MIYAVKAAYAFWARMWLVWKSNMVPSMVTNVINPLLFVFAFGFGLGAIIPEMGGMSYFMYVVPGMMAQAVMFTSTFETTIEAFFRFDRQRTWDAILATPIGLKALLLGEVSWSTTKAMISGLSVFAVGIAVGGVELAPQAFLSLPVLALGAFCFACCGLAFVSLATSFNFFSYTFTFWITPMFMFCGVLFPAERFPEAVQWIGWVFPMRHILEVVRPLTAGLELDMLMVSGHIGYLLLISVCTFMFATNRIRKRLFS